MKNYFASFIPAVKAILGIEAWSKDADKKDALLEEQKQKLKALNFNDTFINGFCEALKDGFPEDSSRKDGESGTKGSGPDRNTSNAVIQGLLADMTAKLVTAQEEIVVLTKEKAPVCRPRFRPFPALRSRTGGRAPSMHVWNRTLKTLS